MCSIENGIKFSVNVRYRPNHHRHYHPPHYWAIQGIIVDKKNTTSLACNTLQKW